jgi:hypothetical protein
MISKRILLNSYLYFCAGQAEDPYDAESRLQPGGYQDDLQAQRSGQAALQHSSQ